MTNVNCTWVFAGGEFSKDQLPKGEIGDNDKLVCVDRGVEHCLAAGLQPDLWIGDMDSVSAGALQDDRLIHVPRHVYPSEKASSDLELALDIIARDPPERVVILGVSGGRTDHMLFNWCLPALRRWPFSLQLIDATVRCYVLADADSVRASTRAGHTVSLLALQACAGVSTQQLQYNLEQASLQPGSTLGLSNVAEADHIEVAQTHGLMLVMIQR